MEILNNYLKDLGTGLIFGEENVMDVLKIMYAKANKLSPLSVVTHIWFSEDNYFAYAYGVFPNEDVKLEFLNKNDFSIFRPIPIPIGNSIKDIDGKGIVISGLSYGGRRIVDEIMIRQYACVNNLLDIKEIKLLEPKGMFENQDRLYYLIFPNNESYNRFMDRLTSSDVQINLPREVPEQLPL